MAIQTPERLTTDALATQGKCETGMIGTSTKYSEHVQGYYCDACDLHLCLKCCMKYKDTEDCLFGVPEESKENTWTVPLQSLVVKTSNL